ncbi:MAG: helix-turn-helix transcriptional regulator, partial [Rubrivivax sp.]|nr:helix-turn-helix transcriptional regulator [Rubrivivax sp.]
MTSAPRLNATALRQRLAQLGLRQWWLAEQLGVDRRTVLRWVNGQVRQVQPAQLQALARVLNCTADDLLLHDSPAPLATADDQRAAGTALAASTVLDRLGPVGEWDVLEHLLRAAAVPDLPPQVLGRLQHQLCVACWRQDKLNQAQGHNNSALAIARRISDNSLLADALGSRANLQFWRGDWPAARSSWLEALALAHWLSPRQRGALHSNLGASLAETGSLQAGRAQLQLALACFDAEGTPMNRSIVQAHLALLALLAGHTHEGEAHARLAHDAAQRGDYRRGLALSHLLDAQVAAQRGQALQTHHALAQANQAFADLHIDEADQQLQQARAWRWLGDGQAALAAAQAALQRSASLPLEHAAALHEQALGMQMLGLARYAAKSLQAAAEAYRRCGAT